MNGDAIQVIREPKKRLLVYIVAYNASKTIESVIDRVPASLLDEYETQVLVIEDSSRDDTFEKSVGTASKEGRHFDLVSLANPINQGYGGNQKLGYHYAVANKFDIVALVHGDGQYAPEYLPQLVKQIATGEAEAAFGSRFMTKGGALKGGMPFYKFIGNRILTAIQNWLLDTKLSEFHSGYRVYSVPALAAIPFELNSNVFHFDTEIIIQFHMAGFRIREVPIPTFYGDEISHVNGLRYAKDVVLATLRAKLQKLGLFYDRKFDISHRPRSSATYKPKFGYRSPHQLAVDVVPENSLVIDLGCAGGYVGEALQKRGCKVVGVDLEEPAQGVDLDRFVRHDLNAGLTGLESSPVDYVLLLDVIEHLSSPEKFVAELREAPFVTPDTKIVVSTGNVGFVLTRLSLFLGQFNYGPRGILDLTHTRLFTFRSVRNLFEQAGYEIVTITGTPVPFPLAIGDNGTSRLLLKINNLLLRIRPQLFAFQSFMVVTAKPSLPYLLEKTRDHTANRMTQMRDVA